VSEITVPTDLDTVVANMGEKYRNGAANYGSVVRNRLKFLIPASILLVFVVWNSSSLSPFDVVSYGPVSYTILSHQVIPFLWVTCLVFGSRPPSECPEFLHFRPSIHFSAIH
jgi:hypothetical protein